MLHLSATSLCRHAAVTRHRLHRFSPTRHSTHMVSCTASTFSGHSDDALVSWLAAHNIDSKQYGQGTAKSIADLLEEVRQKESVLQEEKGKAVRLVSVLNLLVTNCRGQVLHESRQVLPDGRKRRRGLPVSEKMLAGEGWRGAAARAVREELGPALPAGQEPQVHLQEASYHTVQEEMTSPSYPGLTTRYTRHVVSATVPGLPDGDFSTSEPRPAGQLTTHWTWQ